MSPNNIKSQPVRVVPVVDKSKPRQIVSFNLDIDDNTVFLPTLAHLYSKTTGARRDVSSAEWALIKKKIGVEGEWKDFEIRKDSLEDFGDFGPLGKNAFYNHNFTAMARPAVTWQAPSWRPMCTATRHRESAQFTNFITARLHDADSLRAGAKLWAEQGATYAAEAGFYPVTSPALAAKLGGSLVSPADAKAIVMKQLLDEYNAVPLPADGVKVTSPEGREKRVMHLWGFSDDDFENFEKARAALLPEVKSGRWPNVKIYLFFTGLNHPTEKPRGEILMPDGEIREPTRDERGQFWEILNRYS